MLFHSSVETVFVNKAGGFHSNIAEDKILLMFYALSSGQLLSTFW